MLRIAMVLKRGGIYTVDYARRLAQGVRQHLGGEYDILCLTDLSDAECEPLLDCGVDTLVPLESESPGWWAKMELFKLSGPIIYFDLDTVIMGRLDPLVAWTRRSTPYLLMLKGFIQGRPPQSGVMAWCDDVSGIWDYYQAALQAGATFGGRPGRHALYWKGTQYRGDQDFIVDAIHPASLQIRHVQDIMPGVHSYKRHLQSRRAPMGDERIVCFHGEPRLHDLKSGHWMRTIWEAHESTD
uniref:Glycosyltransferase n=1 Tax=viral metagenome TaxID=1070528 RepID=A0A6M3IR76_9ZZZZ